MNPTCGCFLTFSENEVCQLVALGELWLPGDEAVRADLSPPFQPGDILLLGKLLANSTCSHSQDLT